MVRFGCVGAGVFAGILAMSGLAFAEEASGIAIAVVQQASIDGSTGEKVLQPEAGVFSGDRIDTGPIGEAQIRFRDDTKLVVGPNSSLIIDAFVFDDSDTARQVSINAVRGAFRFMTGKSPKDAYTITTPTATIGVRGTEFDISVEKEGTTRVASIEGTTRICKRAGATIQNAGGDCVEVDDPCSLSVIRPTEPVLQMSNDDVEFRNRQLKYYFRYIRDQETLLPDFRVDLTLCKFAEAVIRGGDNPINPPPLPPDVIPPPVPPPPVAPVFTPPSPPSPVDRHDSRPVYDHGPVFRH